MALLLKKKKEKQQISIQAHLQIYPVQKKT